MLRPTTPLLALFFMTACASAPPADAPAPRNTTAETPSPRAVFDAIEARLLAARSVRIDAKLTSEGAVTSSLAVRLRLLGTKMRLDVEGTLEGAPVHASLVSNGAKLCSVGAPKAIAIDTPLALAEGLLLGLTRIGLLHNAAQLAEGEAPEKTDGSARTWALVNDVMRAPDGALRLSIAVRGGSPAEATLVLDALTQWPQKRLQTVHFKQGEMRVEETYTRFVIDDVTEEEIPRSCDDPLIRSSRPPDTQAPSDRALRSAAHR